MERILQLMVIFCFLTSKCFIGVSEANMVGANWFVTENTSCPPIRPSPNHLTPGEWTCYPELKEDDWVSNNTQCIFQCGQSTSVHHCIDGQWDINPKEAGCCPGLSVPYSSHVLCSPNSRAMESPSGTVCIFSCYFESDSHQVGDLTCVENEWIAEPKSILIEPYTLECPPGPSTTTTTISTSTPVSTTTSMITTTSPPLLDAEKVWEFCYLGVDIGITGVVVGDFNGNNRTEFLLGSGSGSTQGSSTLSILEYDLTNNYDCVWNENLDIHATKITKVISGDSVFAAVGLYNGNIRFYDLSSMVLNLTLDGAVGGFPIKNIISADANNDGEMEMIVLGVEDDYFSPKAKLAIFSLSTFEHISSITLDGEHQYWDIAVGHLTNSVSTELLNPDGTILRFSNDLKSLEFVGSFNYKIGPLVAALDVDGDGVDEIIGAGLDVGAYSALDYSRIWFHESDRSVDTLSIGDLYGNGQHTIQYGDDQWGSIHSLDARTGSEIWSVKNPEHGVTFITVGDFDDNGSPDIAWGTDYMLIYGVESKQEEWRNDVLIAPFNGFDIHDSDKDGNWEIVLISSKSKSDGTSSGGITYSIDFQSKQIRWKNNELSDSWEGMNDLVTGDIDNDLHSDVLTLGSYTYDGRIYASKGDKGENIYAVELDDTLNVGILVDLEQDGAMELIVGDRKSAITFIDAESGAIHQTIRNVGNRGEITHIATTVDSEGKVDKVFAVSKNYDTNYGLWMINTTNWHVSKIPTGDIIPESIASNKTNLFVGDVHGFLYILENDLEINNSTIRVRLCDSSVRYLSVDFMESDKITYTCEQHFGLFGLDDGNVIIHHATTAGVEKARAYIINEALYFLTGGDMVRLWAVKNN